MTTHKAKNPELGNFAKEHVQLLCVGVANGKVLNLELYAQKS